MARTAYLTKSISAATVRAINYTPELGQFLQQRQGSEISRLGDLATIRSPGGECFALLIVRQNLERNSDSSGYLCSRAEWESDPP